MSGKGLIILTGLSGAGKTSAARALEDEGVFVVDNLPLPLLPRFLEMAANGGRQVGELAVVIDLRNRSFLGEFDRILETVREAGYSLDIFFLEAAEEVLLRRYSETRRRHPLAEREGVAEGIRLERQLLDHLKKQATAVIDTSELSPHQLRAKIVKLVKGEEGGKPLAVLLKSFGFRHGSPPESDIVMDVRFLGNPHFVDELRPLSGRDAQVRSFVLDQQPCQVFLRHFREMLRFLLPLYRGEGKSYLNISVGCTGGRHRSVAVVEELKAFFVGEGVTLEVAHRDIEKGGT